uniref:3-ketoacyl-CoA synthase 19-like n=1 Tax=Erigeron canadensis TaxID=72917 RepID=UPI001CB9C076|nr:3-ketoacyl-CoA synthase 19-like [Erigeron canadensis]
MESITSILMLFFTFIICVSFWFVMMNVILKNETCYMIDYECYKGRKEMMLNNREASKIASRNKNNLSKEDYKFLLKTYVSSGLGEETYGPKTVMLGQEEHPKLVDSLSEMEEIFYETIDSIFARSKILPSEIDILVVNVSLLPVVPSLTSRIINRYKMREDIKAFNLSGMGCSASVIAIDLVQKLFQTQKGRLAIVVSSESMAANWYGGRERSMMLANCLFRVGGCSMLLTNDRGQEAHKAFLKLKCVVRTHSGSNDEAYNCCVHVEDDQGYNGCRLTKSLPYIAAQSLSKNLQVLLPKVLPFWEIMRFVSLKARSKIIQKLVGSKIINPKVVVGSKINLKSGIEHVCIHPGGRGVIDKVGKSLGINEFDLEPSRMALYRFGNTSVAGIWYALGYLEAKKRLKKGDKILMISLGAGFKCNNCVWEVTRDMDDRTNVWSDMIDDYPSENMNKPQLGWMNDHAMALLEPEEIAKIIGLS